ncbi:MAG: pyrimidine dimer DNA glycosylase/endonuclease V [Planctomycetota bacterium]|nr:pyrimidine dimer DNA glycosylase/endonuclease V [Planctomycetota bacterium]
MNIFAVDNNPFAAAIALPDRHIVKMPLESAQMLAVVMGHSHGLGIGYLRKKDGSHYADTAFYHHPCTQWALSSFANCAWLIVHAQSLLFEYVHRYGKFHGCSTAIGDASNLFKQTGFGLDCYQHHTVFARAMPDDLKYDDSIGSIEAYRRYLVAHKPWAKWDRDPSRKPAWWV